MITTYEANTAPEPTTSESAPVILLDGVGFTFVKLDPALADTFEGAAARGRSFIMTRRLVSEIPLETPPIETLITLAKARKLPLRDLHYSILTRFAGIDQKQQPERFIAEVNRWQRLLDLVKAAEAGP